MALKKRVTSSTNLGLFMLWNPWNCMVGKAKRNVWENRSSYQKKNLIGRCPHCSWSENIFTSHVWSPKNVVNKSRPKKSCLDEAFHLYLEKNWGATKNPTKKLYKSEFDTANLFRESLKIPGFFWHHASPPLIFTLLLLSACVISDYYTCHKCNCALYARHLPII